MPFRGLEHDLQLKQSLCTLPPNFSISMTAPPLISWLHTKQPPSFHCVITLFLASSWPATCTGPLALRSSAAAASGDHPAANSMADMVPKVECGP